MRFGLKDGTFLVGSPGQMRPCQSWSGSWSGGTSKKGKSQRGITEEEGPSPLVGSHGLFSGHGFFYFNVAFLISEFPTPLFSPYLVHTFLRKRLSLGIWCPFSPRLFPEGWKRKGRGDWKGNSHFRSWLDDGMIEIRSFTPFSISPSSLRLEAILRSRITIWN